MLALVQFMLVLDMTVVNVALPQIEEDLGFSQPGLAWVVNSYVIVAGGLLLLGGRLADIWGRRRLFVLGVSVFALASVTCGAAVTPGMLVASRFAQGLGEAMAAPAALGLIVVMFPDARERGKALGIWGGLAGLAAVSGAVISGLLTDLANWRWIFFINVPVAFVVLLLVPRLVPESRMFRAGQRLDFAGAVTVTAGLIATVYGLLQAATHSWGSPEVLFPLVAGVVLLASTVIVEARSPAPLIPLRFFTNRTRGLAYVATVVYTAVFFTYVFLLTLFEQQVLHYSPLEGGLSYLPLGLGLGLGVGLSTALMPRLGAKLLLSMGFFGAATALLLTSGIEADSSYVGGVLPGMILLGVFSGVTMPAMYTAALHAVTGQDASLGSAVQSVMQQLGGALGLAVLVTLASRHSQAKVDLGVLPATAATDGYVLAFQIAALLLALGGLLVVLLLDRVTVQPTNPLLNTNESHAESMTANHTDVASLPVPPS